MSDASGTEGRGTEARRTRGLDAGIDLLERIRLRREPRRDRGDLRSQKVRARTERVLTRVLTGAIYALTTLAAILLGSLPTAVVVCSMSWLCCSEFYKLTRLSGRMPNEVVGLAAAVVFPLMPLTGRLVGSLVALFVFIALVAGWYVVTPRANVSDVAITFFGPVYTSLTLSCIVIIRMCDGGVNGQLLTFGVMGSVWLNDSLAYFAGSRLGKHKLAPRISPNKSVEGLVAGLLGSVLVWILMWLLGVRGLTLDLAVAGGLLVGVFAVVGDLFESRIKRGVGVKDSGTIMPGHGGLLDRSDSMLFGATVAFLLLYLGGML
ncbi:phosphatidate cytidylyltransferase [Olsenella sp. HMSC062G07]|uniref:phosphatidate cytidylyltransferase n=1 Tax=Olsenella sp. HMSC062G07 TaxID=1739330 RepID=UPI0008A3AF1F|nr:phosphatidate cytidylyltransferase [Olsenella sp. HMSC062G07]OFK24422.1 phosphatidate cytidylyltransferase [Olsenella sp. HMSC062G07]